MCTSLQGEMQIPASITNITPPADQRGVNKSTPDCHFSLKLARKDALKNYFVTVRAF
jgi:hypothetical protein